MNLPDAETKELEELRVSPGLSVSLAASWHAHKEAKMMKKIELIIIKPVAMDVDKSGPTFTLIYTDDHENLAEIA